MVLQELGRVDDAMDVANALLDMYDNAEVEAFKEQLISMGAKDVYSLEKAIAVMTKEAIRIASENHWLNADGEVIVENEIYQKQEFAAAIFEYCQKKYASLGEDKTCSECIVTSFYASVCTTLFYYQDKEGFGRVSPFEYLNDHVDLENVDAAAERMLEIKHGSQKADALWNLIYSYAQFSKTVIAKADETETDAAIIDATESAYVLGMLYAMRFNAGQAYNSREKLDLALEKLAESSKDYVYTPETGAMCYSRELPSRVPVQFHCDECGKDFVVEVYEGEEDVAEKYRLLPQKFIALGHGAEIRFLCDECASKLFPSDSAWRKSNVVFKFAANGSGRPTYSFPWAERYSGFKYQVALAFLQGADTIEKLAAATDTELDAETYLEYVREVLGGEVDGEN